MGWRCACDGPVHGGATGERAGMLLRDKGEGHESEKRDLANREETSMVAQRLRTRLPVQERHGFDP